MDEDLILQALQTAAIAAVAASTMPALPIKASGRVFDPPSDQKYLELVYIPNNISGEFWGNEKTYRGLFRLLLHWPIDDQGDYPPLQVIKSVASYFSKAKPFYNGGLAVKILENPDLSSAVVSGADRFFPVSIRYQCYQP